MRLNINHAGRIAILFFCALLLVRVQAQDSGVPTTKPVAPLKDGNQVDEGPQYWLESIGFKNNMAFTNKDALRNLFSITDGEPYNRSLITEGLEKIRSAYAGEGYINFTASPETSINDASHTVSVTVAFEEGKMFYVSRVDIMGLDETEFRKVRKELLVTPGQPYNERLVGVFLRNHRKLLLPNDTSTEPRFTLQRNEGGSTVAVAYDFRRCHVE
jgi:outer membrane translocation and assembly module TamA